MTNNEIVQTTVTRRVAQHRGVAKSADINDFIEETVHDIVNLSSSVNSLHTRMNMQMIILQNENAHLRHLVDALRSQQDYQERVLGHNGFLAFRFLDLNDTRGITFPNNLDDTFSAMVSAEYGEATLPANAIENKFYVSSLRTGRIVTPPDLVVDVKGTFDKGEGEGLVDFERGGKVTRGQSEWAFNGNNNLYWIRRVEFPIDSRVDQVEVQMKATVPEGSSREANMIEVVPFPNANVDVTALSTASDLGTVFTTVPGFTSTDNLKARRYHFPATPVDQVMVRMRQRNWVEENGKKVFYYGLQELGLKLVDYDKRYNPGASLGTNHTFILQMDAPAGFNFQDIHRIDPRPDFLLEDFGKRHVHVKLSSDLEGTNVLWNSDTNLAPQKSGQTVNVNGNPRLYWIVEMNWVAESGGSLSPYAVGTTPYLHGIGVSFTLSEI